jgi:hypothetical protein
MRYSGAKANSKSKFKFYYCQLEPLAGLVMWQQPKQLLRQLETPPCTNAFHPPWQTLELCQDMCTGAKELLELLLLDQHGTIISSSSFNNAIKLCKNL